MTTPKTRTEFRYLIRHNGGGARLAGTGETCAEALRDASGAFEHALGVPGDVELLRMGYVEKVQQVYVGKDRWIDDGALPTRVTTSV